MKSKSPDDKLYDLEAIKVKASFYDLAMHFDEQKVKVSYGSVTMSCPFHKDNSPSFSYNIQNRYYRCFGCLEQGDIFTYVQKKLDLSFRDSVEFVMAFFHIDSTELKTIEPKSDFKKLLRASSKYDKKPSEDFTFFNEHAIQTMVNQRGDFFLDKGFTKETLDFFQVGFDMNEKRVLVPLRDENGKLSGATGRSILPKEEIKRLEIPKWKHYPNSYTGNTLFNLHNAIRESRAKDGSIILVEGPSDTMMLHQHGFKNVSSCLGNSITPSKKGLILRNFMTAYIFLDPDKGGEEGTKDVIKKLSGYMTLFSVTAPEGKDPSDLTQEEVKYALETAQKVS